MNLELLTQIVIDQQREALRFAKGISFLQFIKLLDCINYQCSSMTDYKKLALQIIHRYDVLPCGAHTARIC